MDEEAAWSASEEREMTKQRGRDQNIEQLRLSSIYQSHWPLAGPGRPFVLATAMSSPPHDRGVNEAVQEGDPMAVDPAAEEEDGEPENPPSDDSSEEPEEDEDEARRVREGFIVDEDEEEEEEDDDDERRRRRKKRKRRHHRHGKLIPAIVSWAISDRS